MDDLVLQHGDEAVTTSLKVAETFGKRHDHLLRDIENLKKDVPNFGEIFSIANFPDNYGRDRRGYLMNRDGFSLLVMGFTGKKAMQFKLAYINAFNRMENTIRNGGFYIPNNLPDALRLAADQAEQIAKLEPKADYFDSQMRNPGLMTTTVIAKRFGKSAMWLNQWLASHGIIYRQGSTWVIRQHFADAGYADYENWSDKENVHVHALLKWTQKGQKFIYDTLRQEGIYPISEQMKIGGPQW